MYNQSNSDPARRHGYPSRGHRGEGQPPRRGLPTKGKRQQPARRGPPTEGKQRWRQPSAPPLGRQRGGRSGAGAPARRAFARPWTSPSRRRHLQVSRGSPAELVTRSTGRREACRRVSCRPQTSPPCWRCLQAGPGARRRAPLVSPRAHRQTEIESLLPWTELVRRVPALPPPMDDDDKKEEAASSRRSF
jgi:hypothetical protein